MVATRSMGEESVEVGEVLMELTKLGILSMSAVAQTVVIFKHNAFFLRGQYQTYHLLHIISEGVSAINLDYVYCDRSCSSFGHHENGVPMGMLILLLANQPPFLMDWSQKNGKLPVCVGSGVVYH